ncbi:hypothetical protein CTA2_340 [Colletotrichum tanaceti]|uniref:Uncharacterized protein n=1 Tax=Colletotrichum tanaceti TaxID=1306861 RepID=A0A4U6XEQ4_9PEZI|nr:hypothetical protein CTA2_340 [Colletotrichum tanaceti]TKW54165.1 hypothetical protein CTA1_6682 [Colletotrichum tanaceti]
MGDWLNQLFDLNDSDAEVWASPFQNPASPARWGWVARIQAYWHVYQFGQKFITPDYHHTLDEAFADPDFPIHKSNNGIHQFRHLNTFVYENGTEGKGTKALFSNIINPRDGAMIFENNFSPWYESAEHGGDIPKLNRLSDLAYFQWLDSCKATGIAPSRLRVVFRVRIMYPPAFKTIVQALRRGAGRTTIPSWKDRVTFPINSLPGLAILATAQGASTVWFLVQHRKTLGAKRIVGVTVWGGDGEHRFSDSLIITGEEMFAASVNLRFIITDA